MAEWNLDLFSGLCNLMNRSSLQVSPNDLLIVPDCVKEMLLALFVSLWFLCGMFGELQICFWCVIVCRGESSSLVHHG